MYWYLIRRVVNRQISDTGDVRAVSAPLDGSICLQLPCAIADLTASASQTHIEHLLYILTIRAVDS